MRLTEHLGLRGNTSFQTLSRMHSLSAIVQQSHNCTIAKSGQFRMFEFPIRVKTDSCLCMEVVQEVRRRNTPPHTVWSPTRCDGLLRGPYPVADFPAPTSRLTLASNLGLRHISVACPAVAEIVASPQVPVAVCNYLLETLRNSLLFRVSRE